MTKNIFRCADCRFSSEERPQANMIQLVRMCRYGPLHPVAMLVPGPGGGVGTQIRALCPAVADDDWCHRFEARIVTN